MSELLTNHFSLMSALCVSSSDGIEGQRKSTFSMENVESYHSMSKSIVSSADGTEDQTISIDSMEMDSHISQSCLLSKRAQTLSLFPQTRVSQWKFAYLLSRADSMPRVTLSSTLYLPSYSLLSLTFPEFRPSIVFYRASNMPSMGDIG
jgi:hypothetical protein